MHFRIVGHILYLLKLIDCNYGINFQISILQSTGGLLVKNFAISELELVDHHLYLIDVFVQHIR